MMRRFNPARLAGMAVAVVALASLGFVPSAFAHTGEFAKFDNCASTNPEVFKCIYAKTTGGEVVLGKKTVPIVNPVVLQGGVTEATEESNFISKFVGATNGETLSKAPQPVPGGLLGLVNCKSISNFLVRIACEATLENGFTGANATLELARPASEIQASEVNLLFEEGTALKLPVKVHLENPFLGSSCYVGSSSSPLIWNLTTGTTSPPSPNKPIKGTIGELTFPEEFEIAHLKDAKLVDNAWSAPKATGCGGAVIELLIDPIINAQVGLPAAAGTNTAILVNQIDIAATESVNAH